MTQLYENILLAISGLRANKMRALLTMLGIIIGIGSVIGIVMVGDSMTNSMTSSLQEMGANTVQISLQQRESENGTSYSVYMDEEDYINDEMIEAFLQDYGDVVESVSLQESMGSGRVTEGHRYANVSISGVNSGYQSANHLTMLGGRFIGDKDNKGVKNVAVVSDRLVNNMFGQGQNPLGKEIKVNCGKEQYTFTIIGDDGNDGSGSLRCGHHHRPVHPDPDRVEADRYHRRLLLHQCNDQTGDRFPRAGTGFSGLF